MANGRGLPAGSLDALSLDLWAFCASSDRRVFGQFDAVWRGMDDFAMGDVLIALFSFCEPGLDVCVYVVMFRKYFRQLFLVVRATCSATCVRVLFTSVKVE